MESPHAFVAVHWDHEPRTSETGPPRCCRRLVGRDFLRFPCRQDAGSTLRFMERSRKFIHFKTRLGISPAQHVARFSSRFARQLSIQKIPPFKTRPKEMPHGAQQNSSLPLKCGVPRFAGTPHLCGKRCAQEEICPAPDAAIMRIMRSFNWTRLQELITVH